MSLSLPRDIGLHMGEERKRHAESSYYYTSPTHHSTTLGFQFSYKTIKIKSCYEIERLNQLQAFFQAK